MSGMDAVGFVSRYFTVLLDCTDSCDPIGGYLKDRRVYQVHWAWLRVQMGSSVSSKVVWGVYQA